MGFTLRVFCTLVLLLSFISSLSASQPEYVKGQILIKIDSPAKIGLLRSLAKKLGAVSIERIFDDTLSIEAQQDIVVADFLAASTARDKNTHEKRFGILAEVQDHMTRRLTRVRKSVTRPTLDRSYVITFRPDAALEDLVSVFKSYPWVTAASLNYKVSTNAFPNTLPNDTYVDSNQDNVFDKSFRDSTRNGLWGLERVEAHKAWASSMGENIIVAVLDEGIDPNHPDLTNNIYLNAAEIPNNMIDDDHNGYIDDYYGYNILSDSVDRKRGTWSSAKISEYSKPGPYPFEIHGNAVATVIAAEGNNGYGIVGTAPKAKILPIRVLGYEKVNNQYQPAEATIDILAQAIRYATDRGADVINMSLGAVLPKTDLDNTQILSDAIEYAYSKGVIIIAAAGNSNTNVDSTFPGAHPKVISVAATDYNNKLASFSNFGSTVDVAAPGWKILVGLNLVGLGFPTYTYSNRPTQQKMLHDELSGTSFSSPITAGVVAMMLSLNNSLSMEAVQSTLQSTSRSISFDNGKTIQSGMINAYAAISTLLSFKPCTNHSNNLDVNKDTRVTAMDALLVINWLNGDDSGKREIAKNGLCTDTNKDGNVTAIDALLIINKLNLANGT